VFIEIQGSDLVNVILAASRGSHGPLPEEACPFKCTRVC
jgi:hypothetical protein